MKSELIFIFTTPTVKTNIGRSFTKEELECITNIPTKREERGTVRVGQGRQSKSYDILNKFGEELKDLKTFCEQELKRYLKDIEGVNTDITNLSITASWLNRLEPHDFHDLHDHKNSHLSGVLYIRCLPNDSIRFLNMSTRSTLQLPKKKITQFNSLGISVNIKEGDFIIFPSYILHEVPVNETKDQERISLSFDTWPTHIPSLYYPYK